MTPSEDNKLRIKIMPFSICIYLIWTLFMNIGYIQSKPIIATTTSSSLTSKSIEITGQPKIVDIALPLSLTKTEDLITWATYAIRLMASRINVTVNQMKNESKPPLHADVYNAEVVPRMESIMEQIIKKMPILHSMPTKPTMLHRGEQIKSTKAMPRGFEQFSPSTTKPVIDSRSFDIYSKAGDPRNPYNPFAGIFIETSNDYNPFIRYAPNIVAGPYEQSGTRVFQEHTIYPGVGYLPILSNKNNPFSNGPAKNSSSYQEPHREPTTTTPSMRMELSAPEKIQDFNNALKFEQQTTRKPLITVPFEAYITITREGTVPPAQITVTTTPSIPRTSLSMQTIPDSYSTINNQKDSDYYTTTVRDPPDEFPPFFNKNNLRLKENQNTKVEVVFDDEELTTPKSGKKDKKGKKEKVKKEQKKKKQQFSQVEEALMRLIAPRKRNQTIHFNDGNDGPPIIRIVSERNKKLKKQFNKKSQKKIRLQNVTLESDVDDYDDEKLGENGENNDDNDINNDRGTDNSNNQEEQEEDDEEEMQGSVQALLELLPLLAPILEDLSDPNTKTDLVGIIQGGLPLIQGLIEGDEDSPGIDIGGTIGPVLASLSAGTDGEGSDIAAVLGPILSLIAPLIGPIIGPVIGPLFRLSSNPPDKGFSLGALVSSIAGPLSQPTEPGGMTPFSNLVTQVVTGLSREISTGNSGSDIGALLGSVLMGIIAGTSAGLSGGSSSGKNQSPSAYSPPQGYGPVSSSTNYGNSAVPAHTVNPIQLIGTSLKDILNAGVTVVSSLITAVTGIIGASSQDPPQQSYGPPPTYGVPSQNYNRPRKSYLTRK